MWQLLLIILVVSAEDPADKDGESSRKILGSSVVTSVSVIMDAGNGSKIYADAVGKPVSKPQTAGDIASPIDLLSPDRYEFYTFDDSGDLVKRLMTLEEIQDIIATGDDDALSLDSLASNSFIPEKRVNDVVNNVQNVLKEEIKMHKHPEKPQFDTPDVSDSWSMILPAVFGNSGGDIKPEAPIKHVTPDTIMIEPNVFATTEQISTTEKVMTLQTQKTTPKLSTTTTEKVPMINVEIITNSNSTTERTVSVSDNLSFVGIKPLNELEATKENAKPYLVSKSTKKPFPVRVTTFRPLRKTTTLTTTTTSTTTEPTTTEAQDNTQQTSTIIFEKMDPVSDSIQESSSIVFEKVVPPAQTTTETASTTEVPVTEMLSTTTVLSTTLLPQSTRLAEDTTTEVEVPTTQTAKLTPPVTETTTQSETSTFGSFSTFFMVSDNKTPQEMEKDSDGSSTQTTEYVTSAFTNSTDRSTLDQLLLTSTNIYEINSELSDAKSTTVLEELTTSAEDNSTEKVFVRLTNPTTEASTTTTDQTFIDTIEQLISQAMGTVLPPIEQEKEAILVEEMMKNSTNKTIPEIVSETATVASTLLVGITQEVPETTTAANNIDLLSDSVSSLLSQFYNDVTTIENEGSTVESTTGAPTTTTEPTTTESNFVPTIINITIIRNPNRTQSKPAKSDVSLEKDFQQLYNEMVKNSTENATNEEILKTEATNFFQETTTQEFTETTTEELGSTEVSETTTVPTSTAASLSTTTAGTTTAELKPSVVITINENKTSDDSSKWTLVSTVAPHKDLLKEPSTEVPVQQFASVIDSPSPVDLVPKPLQGFGLEDSTAKLDSDVYQFVQLCNELAFGFWKSVTTGISSARSVIVSPFAATSLLAMVFLGARGATSGEMNEILKLDDMVAFNPHLIFKNVSESIQAHPDSGIAVSAIVRELFSDRSKGKLLGFYKERVRQFYDGHVEEASFREIGDVIRRRTNLLVKKNTDGKVLEFLKDSLIVPKPPLAGVSVSLFQTDCSQGSIEGRDGELHFVVLPTMRQRRLIPIPAITYRSGFLAGYEPSLDATAAALGTKDQIISTIFIIPGQQGMAAPGDGLSRLEKRLVESSFKKGAWPRLLRALIPRPGLEIQIPRFQHRSLINATQSLKRMGLHELFDASKADLKGLNGVAHELHLSDIIQINEFATCGERRIGEAHHKEVYPATTERRSRLLLQDWEVAADYQRAFHNPLHDPTLLDLPLALRPRQARLPDAPRLRFDRPFLYFVRHNPSGLILHMGRFNPRLLP